MMRLSKPLAALALLACGRALAASPARPTEMSVASARVHLGDLVPGAPADAASIELGPSPGVGGSRVIDRQELMLALRSAGVVMDESRLPASVRVLRKLRKLEPRDVEQLVSDALQAKLPRGVSFKSAHITAAAQVPEGWTRVVADVPRPARRVGIAAEVASVTFSEGDQTVWMMSVPVELSVSQEGTTFDVSRGSLVLLLVRRGLVEVTVRGTAGADADIGGLIPVLLPPSGRVVTAHLEDRDHATAVETP